jgi:hypothetical protein
MKIGPNLAGRRVALQRVSVTRSGEDFPDGEGVVSMFFLIRYQTVVASRRLINFARQLFSKVTLVRMTASSFARHFLEARVYHNLLCSKISAMQRGTSLQLDCPEFSPCR